jgi:nucleotide-binding universal stress UspA family protein
MAQSHLFRRILVPHDFSDQATVALKTAAQLAAQHGGKLTLLHVIVLSYLPADIPAGMPMPEDLIPQQREHLEQLARKALGRDGPPLVVQVELGDAAERIIDRARGHDSIVMATSGRTGLAHFLIGSVAEKVVRHAQVPVLTLRAPRRERRSRRQKK